MKHLEKIREILKDTEKSPQARFDAIWNYERAVLRPELELDMVERTRSRVTSKEGILSWYVSSMLGFFKNKGVAPAEWADLCPAFLEGIAEFIESPKEKVVDQDLKKADTAMSAMEARREELVERGLFDELEIASWGELGQ